LDEGAEKGRQIVEGLQAEGLQVVEKVDVKVNDEVFVISAESGEMSSTP
jgi:hypothetical protein